MGAGSPQHSKKRRTQTALVPCAAFRSRVVLSRMLSNLHMDVEHRVIHRLYCSVCVCVCDLTVPVDGVVAIRNKREFLWYEGHASWYMKCSQLADNLLPALSSPVKS